MAGEETLNPYERLIRGTAKPIPGLSDTVVKDSPDIQLTLGKVSTYIDNEFKNHLSKINNAFRILAEKTMDASIKTTGIVENLSNKIKKYNKLTKRLFVSYRKSGKQIEQQRVEIEKHAKNAEEQIVDKIEKTEKHSNSVYDMAMLSINNACKIISFTFRNMKILGRWISKDGKTVNNIVHFLYNKGNVYKSLSGMITGLGDKLSEFIDNTFGKFMWFFGSFGGLLFRGLKFLGSIGWKIFEWVAKVGFYTIDFMWRTFKGLAQIGWDVISNVFTGIVEIGKKAGSFLLDVFIDVISNPILVAAAIFGLKYWFNKDKKNIFDKFMDDIISPAFHSFMAPIKDAFNFTNKSFMSVMGWGQDKINYIKESLASVFDQIKNSPIINNWFTNQFVEIVGVSYAGVKNLLNEYIPKITDFIIYIKDEVISKLPIDGIRNFVSEVFDFVQVFYNMFKFGTKYSEEKARQQTIKSAKTLLKDRELDLFNKNIQNEIMDIVEVKYNNLITNSNRDLVKVELNKFVDSYIQAKQDKISDDKLIVEIRKNAKNFIESIIAIDSGKLRDMKLGLYVDQATINNEITNIKWLLTELDKNEIPDIVNTARINITKLIKSSEKDKQQILKDHISESNRLNELIFGQIHIDLQNFNIDNLQQISELNKSLINSALLFSRSMADLNALRQTFTVNLIGYHTSADYIKKKQYLQNIIDEIRKAGGEVPNALTRLYENTTDITINQPNVSQMAEGGLIQGATLAVIGEGPDPEVVIPINKDGITFIYNSMIEKFDEYEDEIEKESASVINTMGGITIQQADDMLFDLSNISKGILVLG